MATSARGGGEGGGVFTNIALAWLTVVAAKHAAIIPLLLNRCSITPHLPIRRGTPGLRVLGSIRRRKGQTTRQPSWCALIF